MREPAATGLVATLLIVGALNASALAQGAREAGVRERLTMPFACRIDGGRLEITPAPDLTYDILDRREQMPFTVCFGAGGECRAWTAHRFTVACGGQRVGWDDIALAASRYTGVRMWPVGDRTMIAPRQAAQSRTMRDCYDQIAGRPMLPFEQKAAMVACWQGRLREPRSRAVELPPGFAPLAPFGARVITASVSPQQAPSPALVAKGPLTTQVPVPGAPGEKKDAPAARPADRLARPDGPQRIVVPSDQPAPVASGDPVKPPAVNAPGATASDAVVPVQQAPVLRATAPEGPVVPAPRDAAGSAQPDQSYGYELMAVSGAGLATIAAFLVWGRRRSAAANRVRIAPALDGPPSDAAMARLLLEGARRTLEDIAALLASLAPSSPLRQVLSKELRAAERRLSALAAEDATSPASAKRHRARVQSAVHDVNRLRDIATGAQQSLEHATHQPAVETPSDRASAFAVLGVTPDADAGTLKKLVDALRRAWHPDLARDEQDRLRREERIKQINVAWDLIQGRRVET